MDNCRVSPQVTDFGVTLAIEKYLGPCQNLEIFLRLDDVCVFVKRNGLCNDKDQ